MMTSLSGRECHNHTKKRVGCDSHVQSARRRHAGWPSGPVRIEKDKYHDLTKKNDT